VVVDSLKRHFGFTGWFPDHFDPTISEWKRLT
jgi:hypothetical protein